MPTTETIPYPLGSDPSGVVLYTDLSNVPQTGLTYTLRQNGTQVSDPFTYITDYAINMGFLTTDASYLAYYSAFSTQLTANNVPIVVNSGPNLVFNGAMTTDTSGNIYTICEFVYNVTVNIFDYTDFDTNTDYYTQQTGNTGEQFPREVALVKIDPFYGTLQYLLTGVNVNSFILDPTRTYLYYLVDGGTTQQKTLIKKIALSNGTESEVYRDENFTSTPYSMTMDSFGNLYVAENYGRILKVVPSTGTAVVYATFEYDISQQPNYPTEIRYGKPQAIACDSSNNLYVIDNGTSINGVSVKCMIKIPYTNTPGTNYRPATVSTTYDAIPGLINLSIFDTFFIQVDDLNHLYSSYNNRVYKVDMASPSLGVYYENLSVKAKAPNNNILCGSPSNIKRIAATTYTFINVYVSNYSGQNYVDLSLNNGTTDIAGAHARVYNQILSSDATLSVFTLDGVSVLNGESINVPHGTTSVTVVATTTDVNASTNISGETNLQPGLNTVTVIVTAEDGVTQLTYTADVQVSANILCFREDTQILCLIEGREMYVPIQSIQKGVLVKTLLHGYMPVETIGCSKIYNPPDGLRLKNRLYKLKPAQYPELTQPLYLTGCHSILVSALSNTEREDTIGLLGRLFITENKYRLMACIDERAKPYRKEGIYNIWHFSLEHVDYYKNYGVYANGLLVESSSRRMMREYFGVTAV